MDVLREEKVKATFFVTGKGSHNTSLDEDLERQDILRQIFYEGHQIGSHSWNHDNLTEKSVDEIRTDLSKLAAAVKNIIGVNMTVFRAPYGEVNFTIATLIEKEFDYQLIYWNIDTMDWLNQQDTESSLMNYTKRIRESSWSRTSFIALHHCSAKKSGELAKMAIKFVKSKGFKLVTVAECIRISDFKYQK